MALSGSVTTNHFSDSTVSETYMQFNWSATQSTSGNYSTVTWEIVAHRVNTSNYVYFHNFTRNVNGSSGSKGSTNFKNNEVIDSGSFTVYHNDNGTGSFSMSMSANIYYSSGGAISVSKTFTLDTIPRYMDYVYISQRAKTTSSISLDWSTSHARDWTQYSLNGGAWTNAGDIVASNNKSGYFTINGLSPNTNYTVKIRCRRTDSGLWSESGSISIRTYQKTVASIWLDSKTINSITVASNCNVEASSTWYNINGASWQQSPTFTGLSPNTTYTIQVEKIGKESGEYGYAEIKVTTYDIARLTSCPDFNLGDDAVITYNNPSGSNIQIGIYSDSNDSNGYAIHRNCSGSSYTFNFTDTELDSIYKALGNNNYIDVSISLVTLEGSAIYREHKNVRITLTGNQKTVHIGKSREIRRGKVFIARNGIKRGVLWRGVNGTARRCI